MINNESIKKNRTNKYMKPHEKVLCIIALIIGIILVISGIIMLLSRNEHLFTLGIILVVIGVTEGIFVAIFLSMDGKKMKEEHYVSSYNTNN